MKSFVVVNLQYEALHYWEDADSIPEVSFLRHPHRHVFHIRCTKEVVGHDREIEFIVLKHKIEKWLDAKYNHNLLKKSCEMLAKEILRQFECESVEVLEDGENGAIITK